MSSLSSGIPADMGLSHNKPWKRDVQNEAIERELLYRLYCNSPYHHLFYVRSDNSEGYKIEKDLPTM